MLPSGRSPLEAIRNYQQEIQGKGGKVLFECKGDECGGDVTRNSSGGGGKVSLAMYLYPQDRVTYSSFNNEYCAQTERLTDQRFLSAEIAPAGAHVAVHAFSLKDDINGVLICKILR